MRNADLLYYQRLFSDFLFTLQGNQKEFVIFPSLLISKKVLENCFLFRQMNLLVKRKPISKKSDLPLKMQN